MKSLILSAFLTPFAAFGTTIVATTVVDEDNGSLAGGAGVSLREAVKYSAAGDTITFAPILSGQTIRLALGQIRISKALNIDGSALPAHITLSGDRTGNGKTSDDSRVFYVDDAALTLDSLTFADSSNSDTFGGGAVKGIGHSARLVIDRCTFRGNHGDPEGGAILFVGAYQTPETALIVRDSTFFGNSASDFGGAIFAQGILDIQTSTFTSNTAANGGGVFITNNTTSLIQDTTITGNTATSKGGGIYNTGTLVVSNSIIAKNSAPISPTLFGPVTSFNNLTSGDPLLAPLGDYGGHTQTMPPMPGSPAINVGPITTATPDQRGFSRVGISDIGAAEFQGRADLAHFWKLDTDCDGNPYGVEQALGTDPFIADSTHPNQLTTPSFNANGQAILTFGIAAAAPGTIWMLKRSSDLRLGSFVEIFRSNGVIDSTIPNVSSTRTATHITVTDGTPLASSAFYRFEALLAP